MESRRFVATLKELGYPNAQDLDPQAFDWLFENEATLPFLEWFSDNIHASNVLQPREVRDFQTMQQSPEGILEGRQLEDALQMMSLDEDEDVTDEKLRNDILMMKEELENCQKRKEKLTKQRNRISLHHTSLSHRLSKMGPLETRAKQEYKKSLEQSQEDNMQTNKAIGELSSTLSELTSFYTLATADSPARSQGPDNATFLSQMDLGDYHREEECFTQELTNFTKKQFFEGIAEIADQKDSRYELLEISNPESLLVKGETEQVNLEDCEELARLKELYPKSETRRLNSLVAEQSLAAACQFSEQKLGYLKRGQFPKDMTQLRAQLQNSEASLSVLQRDIAKLTENDVPMAIQKAGLLQEARVLTGDYNLKIARQDYFTSNQDKVVAELIKQRSRNEFLTMGYEVEARDHRDTRKLLSAVSMQLQKFLKAYEARMVLMSNPMFSSSKQQRGTIDSRDKFISRLHNIVVPYDNRLGDSHQLFLTYASLVEGAEKLHHHHASLEVDLRSAMTDQDNRLSALERNLKSCEAVVYAGSTTTGGQPLLSPQPLVDNISQLDNMVKKLEQSVMEVITNLDGKKKALKTDPLLAREQQLYLYFFNNPEALKQTLEDVNSRLKAQMAS